MDDILNKGSTFIRRFFSILAVLLILVLPSFVLSAQRAEAVGTPAGTSIGYQAVATYEDSAATVFTSTSNQVDTTVTAVRSLTVTPSSQASNATPGGIIYYPYVLTNTGNDIDSFNLSSVITSNSFTGTFSVAAGNIAVFSDTNGNGSVDPGEPQITNGSALINVPADGIRNLVMQIRVPATALVTESATVDLQATSVGNPAVSDTSNLNTTTVVNNAVVTAVKSVDKANANPGDTLTYSFNINNIGNTTARQVTINDTIPANTTFVAASAVVPAGTLFSIAGSVVTFTTDSLPAANARTFSFQVTVNAGTPAGNIPNNGQFTYRLTDNTTVVPAAGSANTNTVNTAINTKSAVSVTFSGTPFSDSSSPQTTSGTDLGVAAPGNGTDKTSTASGVIAAGNSVWFKNVITNRGNAPDTFIVSGTTPAGFNVTFFQLTDPVNGSANNTPLIGNSTGVMPIGGTFTFVTKVDIPAGAASAAYDTIVTATSSNGGTALGTATGSRLSDITTDTISDVITTNVTLQNIPNIANVNLTTSADGGSVTFPLRLKNNGGGPDTFNLSALFPTAGSSFTVQFFNYKLAEVRVAAAAGVSTIQVLGGSVYAPGDTIKFGANTYTVSTVANVGLNSTITLTSPLVAGLIVGDFGTGVLNPVALTSVGVIPGLASTGLNAVVTAAAGLPAGVYSSNFTATSTNDNTKSSTVNDSVTVGNFRTFTLTQNRSSQAPAGGVVFNDHRVTNTGNVPLTVNLSVTATAPAVLNFGYQILDAVTNLPITSLTVARGTFADFKIKVTIPGGSATGYTETATIVATETVASGTAQNLDDTTVIAGVISLVKSVTNFTTGGSGATAKPGDVLEYTIVYRNVGSITAFKVKITDAIPNNTTYMTNPASTTGDLSSLQIDGIFQTIAADADFAQLNGGGVGVPGGLTVFFVGAGATPSLGGSVAPNGTGTVKFRVRVNP